MYNDYFCESVLKICFRNAEAPLPILHARYISYFSYLQLFLKKNYTFFSAILVLAKLIYDVIFSPILPNFVA